MQIVLSSLQGGIAQCAAFSWSYCDYNKYIWTWKATLWSLATSVSKGGPAMAQLYQFFCVLLIFMIALC